MTLELLVNNNQMTSVHVKQPLVLKGKIPLVLKKSEVTVLQTDHKKSLSAEHPVIKGLYYYPNFLSSDEGKSLITDLDSNKKWVGVTTNPKSRRVIHYGYTYPYTGGPLQKTDSIPQTYNEMLSKFQKTEPMEEMKEPFDQLFLHVKSLTKD